MILFLFPGWVSVGELKVLLLKTAGGIFLSCQQEADMEQERPTDWSSSGRRFDCLG